MARYYGILLFSLVCCGILNAQVRFKLSLLPDNITYRVSMVPSVTWAFPNNLTASAQVTIKVPHTEIPYGFLVGNLVSLQPGTEWDDNVRINAPIEAPDWDYISFGLISGASSSFNYEQDIEIPLFEFANSAEYCVGDLVLLDNQSDPFLPPNSVNANIGNSITTLGGGLTNACWGIVGDGHVPCLPNPPCSVVGPVVQAWLCDGEAYEGLNIQQDTVLVKHFISEQGCDSMVITNIVIVYPFNENIEKEICIGSMFHGAAIFNDTTIIVYNQGYLGCDSIISYQIEAVEYYYDNQVVEICSGDDFMGIPIYEDTLIISNLIATTGCDSVIEIAVAAVQEFETSANLEICQGQILMGQVIQSDTMIIEYLQTARGCDSTNTIYIKVNPAPEPELFEEKLACQTSLHSDNFAKYQWSTGETTPFINIYAEGNYILTVTDSKGCTATTQYNYIGTTNITAEIETKQPGCLQDELGTIIITNVSGGVAPYTYSNNNGIVFSNSPKFESLKAGDYPIIIEDAVGCSWVSNVTISAATAIELQQDDQLFIKLGGEIELGLASNYPIDSVKWLPETGLECPICKVTMAKPLKTTEYEAIVYTSNGCITSVFTTVYVDLNEAVFIPNSFSPNGDGINDYFCVFASSEVTFVKTMKVFDRYGSLVYKAENLTPNKPEEGWNGLLKTAANAQGVFTYLIEIELLNKKRKILSGEIAIIR